MEDSRNPDLKYHYDREQRLKKLHRPYHDKGGKPFSKRKRRGLIIVVVDLLLIAAVMYYLVRPANVHLDKEVDGLLYELNVSGIRGGKTLVAFTVKNLEKESFRELIAAPVTVSIKPQKGESRTFRRFIEPDTVLGPGEISSTVFLLDEGDLPDWGQLELFYVDDDEPLFVKNVRF
jgi:hypothetical protein